MTGRPPGVWDCGPHGQLTRAQIAKLAGVSIAAIDARIACGKRGADLYAPPRGIQAAPLALQPHWPAAGKPRLLAQSIRSTIA